MIILVLNIFLNLILINIQRLGSFKRLGLPRGKHFETSYHYHVDLTRYHVVLTSEDFSLHTELVRARALPSLSDSGLVTGQSTLHTVLTACRDMSGHSARNIRGSMSVMASNGQWYYSGFIISEMFCSNNK